jgi:hypothetical protein
MECHNKHQAILLSLTTAVMLLCISCQNRTQLNDHAAARDTYTDKCLIDLSSPPPQCPLSKAKDERVVWINNSDGDLNVCFDPNNHPFGAYSFNVPRHNRQPSGKISASVNPGQEYGYYSSSSPCVWPPPGVRPRTNPKIIIQ